MITRFSIIPDERRVLLGVDKSGIFDAGIVYQVTKILGQIIMTPIGEYALEKKGCPSEGSDIATIMYSGLHLITSGELDSF